MIDPEKISDEDATLALQYWENYQKTHDVSALRGKAVGIDPHSGRVWFGDNAREVVQNARADGVTSSLLGLRVGENFYLRKGWIKR